MSTERILRHPNGGAQKIGTEVHVSADSYCGRGSVIAGDSVVLRSTLVISDVRHSKLFNSQLQLSSLGASVVSESHLIQVTAEGCVLDRIRAFGGPFTEGFVEHGRIYLRDVVAETCELYGTWNLCGIARIHEGRWTRSPRFQHITGDNQVSFGLTECKPGYAMLGCWCKPLKELLHAGPRLGRKRGWTEKQIQEAREFYEMLADCPEPM